MDISFITPFLKIINIAILILCTFISIKIVSYILDHLNNLDKNINFISMIKDIINCIITIVFLILLFNIFNIDLKGIFLSIGIVGIIITFAAKDLIANFMSGFFIIAYNTLEIGDVMQINNWKGSVERIGIRDISLITENKDEIIIPNSTLSNSPFSIFRNHELEKVEIKVMLPLKIDIADFNRDILNLINSYDDICSNPKPKIETTEITKDGVLLNIKFWIKMFNKKEKYTLIITNQIRKYITEILGDDN